jgi:hypothetical protein
MTILTDGEACLSLWEHKGMTKKRPRDPNQLAKFVVEIATGSREHSSLKAGKPGTDPAASALGRLGGLKGGKARAARLSPGERSRIAREAAAARWKKDDG